MINTVVDGEEIKRPDMVFMISQKCLPGLLGLFAGRFSSLWDIFRDGVERRDIGDSEADESIMNTFGAPNWIFIKYAFDESNSRP